MNPNPNNVERESRRINKWLDEAAAFERRNPAATKENPLHAAYKRNAAWRKKQFAKLRLGGSL